MRQAELMINFVGDGVAYVSATDKLTVCISGCWHVLVHLTVVLWVCVSMSDSSAVCEFTASNNSSVKCLAYSPTDNNVYVVLDGGRMVICTGAVTSSRSPVRTECHGNGRPIHCITVRALDSGFVTLCTSYFFSFSSLFYFVLFYICFCQ